MEVVNNIIKDLGDISTKYTKIGRSARSGKWGNLEEEVLQGLEDELNRIEKGEAEDSEEGLFELINKAKELLADCRKRLRGINTGDMESRKETSSEHGRGGKMEFKLKDACSYFSKEFNGEGTYNVMDFVTKVQFYHKQLQKESEEVFSEFLYSSVLMGAAKRIFKGVTPSTVDSITTALIDRFKKKETLAGIQQKITSCYQGNWKVDKFAARLEELGIILSELNLAKHGVAARSFILKSTEDTLLSAFKQGLNKEIQMVVIASNTDSLATAIDIALTAEASNRDMGVDFANLTHNKKERAQGSNTDYRTKRPGEESQSHYPYQRQGQRNWNQGGNRGQRYNGSGNNSQGVNRQNYNGAGNNNWTQRSGFSNQQVHAANMVEQGHQQQQGTQPQEEFFRE